MIGRPKVMKSPFRAAAILSVLAVFVVATWHEVGSTVPWPLYPQGDAHPINKTYGDWNGRRCYVETVSVSPETLAYHIVYHTGTDLPADSGTPVLAVADGYEGKPSDSTGMGISVDEYSCAIFHRQNLSHRFYA